MLMVGAKITMLCSVLFQHDIEQIRMIEKEMLIWMDEHEYESVKQMQGEYEPNKLRRPFSLRAITVYERTINIHAYGLNIIIQLLDKFLIYC